MPQLRLLKPLLFDTPSLAFPKFPGTPLEAMMWKPVLCVACATLAAGLRRDAASIMAQERSVGLMWTGINVRVGVLLLFLWVSRTTPVLCLVGIVWRLRVSGSGFSVQGL